MRQEEVYSVQQVSHHHNPHREVEVFNYNAERVFKNYISRNIIYLEECGQFGAL